MTPTLLAKFQETILNILVERGGKESISSVLQEARYAGWKNLGNLSRFESLLTEAGFTLDRRTYGNQPYIHGAQLVKANGSRSIHVVVKTYVTL